MLVQPLIKIICRISLKKYILNLDMFKNVLIIVALIAYLLLQVVGPRLTLSLIPNSDRNCYSGRFSFIEKISPDGSCGASQKGLLGFPLVFNFNYNSGLVNTGVFVADMVPWLILSRLSYKRRRS